MEEEISTAIERAEKAFVKRSRNRNFDQTAEYKIIYIGGRWDSTKEERKAIVNGINKFNVESFIDGKMERGLMVPLLEEYDFDTSLRESERKHASVSDAYFEIIGDGFGDTSFGLARAAYETARKLNIPTGILVKNKRTANHPKYALDFLKLVKRGEILKYDNPYDASVIVQDWLEKRFK